MEAKFGIKSMDGLRDAKNSHWEYVIEQNLGRDDAIKKAEYSRLSSVPAARHVSFSRKETYLATRSKKRRLYPQFMFFCNTFFP